MLVEAKTDGVTQEEIAETLGVTYAYITCLLRYHRFELTTVNSIPEGRFRAYWQATFTGDAPRLGKLPKDPERARAALEAFAAKRDAYERPIFTRIAAQIAAGEKPPTAVTRTTHRAKPNPRNSPTYQKQLALRKEVQHIFHDKMNEQVDYILRMVGRYGTIKFSPDLLSVHADMLKRGMRRLTALLKTAGILDNLPE